MHQHPSIRSKALTDVSCTVKMSPRRRRADTVVAPINQVPLPSLIPTLPALMMQAGPSVPATSVPNVATWLNTGGGSSALTHTASLPIFNPLAGGSDPGPGTPEAVYLPSRASTPSIAPGDSISNVSGPRLRRQRSRVEGDTGSPAPSPGMHWNSDRQKDFEKQIGRLTASAGLPLSWVDNPEFITLIDTFIPAANPPSRKTLTRRIIPSLVRDFRMKAIAAVKKERFVTLQADGWTGENHHHYIAFMISAGGKVCSLKLCGLISQLVFSYIQLRSMTRQRRERQQ